MNYSRYTVEALFKRLGQYAPYVGCGCYNNPGDNPRECKRQPECAMTDYRLVLKMLRARLTPKSDKPREP